MQNPEKPISSKEVQQQKPAPYYVELADKVHTKLQVEENKPTLEEWKSLMSEISKGPPLPKASKVLNPAKKSALKAEYNRLMEEPLPDIERALDSTVVFANSNNDIPPILHEGMIRDLARYVYAKRKYDNMWRGKDAAVVEMPKFIADYIKISPENLLASDLAGQMMQFQYDVLDQFDLKNVSPIRLSPIAKEISVGAMQKRLSMKDVLACLSGGVPSKNSALYKEFLTRAGFAKADQQTDQQINGAKLLVGYINKNMDSVKRYAKIRNNGDTESLTIGDALRACTGVHLSNKLIAEVVGRAGEMWDNGVPNLVEFSNRLFDAGFLTEQMQKMALEPLLTVVPKDATPEEIQKLRKAGPTMPENPTEKQQEDFRVSAEKVSKFMLTGAGKTVSVTNMEQHWKDLNDFEKGIAKRIRSNVTSPEMVQKLLGAVFIKPPAIEKGKLKTDSVPDSRLYVFDLIDREVAEALVDICQGGKINLRDAFEIHYLTHYDSNLMALTYKVINLLDREGYKKLAKELQFKTFRNIVDTAWEDADTVSEMANKMGFSKDQSKELSNLRRYMNERGMSVVTGLWDSIVHWHKYFPEFAYGLDALVAGRYARRGLIRLQWGSLEEFARMTPKQLDEWMKKHGMDPENVAHLQKAQGAQSAAKEIIGQADKIGFRNELIRKIPRPDRWLLKPGQLRRQGIRLMREIRTGELSQIADSLLKSDLVKGRNTKDVTSYLMKMSGNHAEVAKALHDNGFEPDVIKTEIEAQVKMMHGQEIARLTQLGVGNPEAQLGNVSAAASKANIDVTAALQGRKRKPVKPTPGPIRRRFGRK